MDGIQRTIGLRPGPIDLHVAARAAIKAEHQQSSQWTTLRCRGTAHVRGTLWRLTAPDLSSVSWAWEGATAACPIDPTAFDPGDPDTLRWMGTVVSADDSTGILFVDVSFCSGDAPDAGTFLVKPYAFLASLHRLYVDPLFGELVGPLSSALQATTGADAGAVVPASGPERISAATGRSWGVLWGPPGTGKTYTIGEHVAALWGEQRVLVVSTTNRATDGAALSIARAIRTAQPGEALRDRLVRVGSGADLDRFVPEKLASLLAGGEVGLRRRLVSLRQERSKTRDPERRAAISTELQQVRRSLEGCSKEVFLAEQCRVVVTTAFNALRQLTDPDLLALAEAGRAPFDIVIIDEAGLVCRAAAAALSLLAAGRVLLVGDPCQLAPIAKMSRLLPPAQAVWLSESALSHLSTTEPAEGVCMLRVQYRMNAQIREAVSLYQYDGLLEDAPHLQPDHADRAPPLIPGFPRAGWFVLEESAVLADARAERGPKNRSWVRPCTPLLLELLLDGHPQLSGCTVLIVTPFAAQARALASWIQANELRGWSASTVHSQQGAEADVVLFDTVSGGLAAWPPGEWQRLVNVGLSRAREHVLLLATRDEMTAPWLAPLQDLLSPCALRPGYGGYRWRALPAVAAVALPGRVPVAADGLGAQIAATKAARPVLSADQERLVGLPMDGGPRLVRGVAGSGKTLVLAHWLARVLREAPQTQPLWVVYGNSSLQRPLTDCILAAWQQQCPGRALPWQRVRLWHIRELLRALLPERGLSLPSDEFDYDPLCQAWLSRRGAPHPRCAMLFIDEAQDFGPATLRLLARLAPQQPGRPGWRPVMVFYDHDQNIYRRTPPRWSALGIAVKGRTALLREGFRSTRPITAAALNTLYQLRPPTGSPAYRQLLRRGLVRPTTRGQQRWWQVRFSAIDGPIPTIQAFPSREAELLAITQQLSEWVLSEGVLPGDIRVLCGAPELREELTALLAPALESAGLAVAHLTGRTLPRDPRTLLITTPHSFKGHDAEVVVLPGIDRLATRVGPLAHVLYVAMTRARSVLWMSGLEQPALPAGKAVLQAAQRSVQTLRSPPAVALPQIDAELPQREMLRVAGEQHLAWLAQLWARQPLRWEPLPGLPQTPLFWFPRPSGRRVACFAEPPPLATQARLAADGIDILPLGGNLPEDEDEDVQGCSD